MFIGVQRYHAVRNVEAVAHEDFCNAEHTTGLMAAVRNRRQWGLVQTPSIYIIPDMI